MSRLWIYYAYLLIVWGVFRFFVRLPEVIEELWFKPMIWLVPLFWWNMSMKQRVEMFGNRKLVSILIGLVVGLVYYLLIRRLSVTVFQIDINLIGIALATAVTEELVFSGFVAGYLEKIRKGSVANLLITGAMVAGIKLPILLFVYHLGSSELVGVLMFSAASGVINAWIRVETGNVLGSILARTGLNFAVLA